MVREDLIGAVTSAVLECVPDATVRWRREGWGLMVECTVIIGRRNGGHDSRKCYGYGHSWSDFEIDDAVYDARGEALRVSSQFGAAVEAARREAL